MDKKLKILIGITVFLGIVSAIILFINKKPSKSTAVTTPKTTIQATAPVGTLSPLPVPVEQPTVAAKPPKTPVTKKVVPKTATTDQQQSASAQWRQCKAKTLAADTKLLWKVQITEGIPVGGTYAKGNLEGDVALPVQVIIKPDSTVIEKIKSMLVVGKTAFLRGTCTDVAADGAVVLQAF